MAAVLRFDDSSPTLVVGKKKLRILHELVGIPLSLIMAAGLIHWGNVLEKRQGIPELAEVQAQAIVPTFVLVINERGPLPGPIVAKITAVRECDHELCVSVKTEVGEFDGLKAPIESLLKPGQPVVVRFERAWATIQA